MKRFREPTLSPEAAAYLEELRTLTADELHERRVRAEHAERTVTRQRAGAAVRARFHQTGSLRR